MAGRNPFFSVKLNDAGRQQQGKTYDVPTHIAQSEEPWSRLNDTATVSSTRRSVMHRGRQVPRDSLDFHLKSVYDHHRDYFWKKTEILYQKETVFERKGTGQETLEKDRGNEIRVWVDPQRRSIDSIK